MLHVYAVQYCTACSQYSITTQKYCNTYKNHEIECHILPANNLLSVRIWIGLDVFFHHSLRNQQAAPHNRTKYQQPTCAMQFSPCVFLYGFCPVFQHAERDTCSRLCWPKFSIRSVGTVKLVCFLSEFCW